MTYSNSSTKENEAPAHHGESESKTAAPNPGSRNSGLSWQKRPASRGNARPLSMMATQNASQRMSATQSRGQQDAGDEQTMSREDIAKTLGLKDPSWFRQTDRGQGAAAFRKNQVEDSDTMDMASVRSQLPGMSADTPNQRSSTNAEVTSPTENRLASPVSLNPPRFEYPTNETSPAEGSADPASGRGSPMRSGSPTKGLGGFVQSAMMKRSDSVKRWSVTSPPGLNRADSVSANIGSHKRDPSRSSPRPRGTLREESSTPDSSRPTSRSGLKVDTETSPDNAPGDTQKRESADGKLPTSPSKTMDSRRWSPTKSSWLESALNRPESPKPQPRHQPSQPDWMTELNKSKMASPSSQGSRPGSPHKHDVSIGGLMRSTPFDGGAKPNTTGMGGIYSPPQRGSRTQFGHGLKPSISAQLVGSEDAPPEKAQQPPEEQISEVGKPEPVSSPPPLKPKPNITKDIEPEMMQPAKDETMQPAQKPKPATSPENDFRTNLRQRPGDSGPKQAEEPEFRNALGNLRRTKTQNYVAPDELKDNILRGKAGLNVTGGPQRTERRDEFKDAILKKREGFKQTQAAGKGVVRNDPSATKSPVPEGLAKRAELGNPTALRSGTSTATEKSEATKPVPAPKREPSGPGASSSATQAAAKSPSPEQIRRVSTEPTERTAIKNVATPTLKTETSAPSKLNAARPGAGKLADRFNPGLANMLARGPPPMAANGRKGSEDSAPEGASSGSGRTAAAEPSAPGPQLTHMTKNRARGPRRKAPTGAVASKDAGEPGPLAQQAPETSQPFKESATAKYDAKEDAKAQQATNKTPGSLSVQEQVAARAATKDKPSPKTPLASSPPAAASDNVDPPQSPPKKLDVKRRSKFLDEDGSKPSRQQETQIAAADTRTAQTKYSAEVKPPIQASSAPSPTTSAKSPDASVKSPQAVAAVPAKSPASSASGRPGNATTSSNRTTPPTQQEPQFNSPTRAMPSRNFGSIRSPSPRSSLHGPRPQVGSPRPMSRSGRPASSAGSAGASAPGSPMPSPTKQPSEISVLLKDFFGPARPRKEYKADTAEVLTSRSEEGAKIQTSEVQMYRLTGDGKKVPIAAQNERCLFEEEMYVCAHQFTSATGKKLVELYFWVGDEVPEATVQDAQIFAQREAKAVGGQLIKLYQGKETTEFLQALGGVIIVRRGSSDKYDSLAPQMLCGRRFLDQVVFDEVDIATTSLCAGFVYLISAGGKCFLWKGKGSDVDELSAAKLVGMEMSITGELMEVEEGNEPASFWELFDGGSKPHSADHWRLKPTYGRYCSRLFCSDADSRRQVSRRLIWLCKDCARILLTFRADYRNQSF